MSTPILTKQQQKLALSAKKTSNKGLRNVLAQPQDSFWPVVEAENRQVLEDVFKKLMSVIKRPSHAIPWSQLRLMKKEERAQAKKEAILKQEITPNTEITNSVLSGINAITRSMEKNDVCCVLIDANIDPQLLVKHIVIMAQNKKVPVLLLPSLKSVTLNTIGFATAACALKNTVKECPDHHFHPLYTTVCDVFGDIPLPMNSLQLFKDIENSEDLTLSEEEDMNVENEALPKPAETTKFTLSTNVYKYRSSCKERAFVPPSTAVSSTSEPVTQKIEGNEFISLKDYSSDESDTHLNKRARYVTIRDDKKSRKQRDHFNGNNFANVKYLPLKVKRIQGNSNRVKATKSLKQKKKN